MNKQKHSLTNLWVDAAPVRLRLGRISQALYAVMREVTEAGLDYRAMSLVYTSLLALVPLLAVSFSVLKAFGAHTQLEPLLLEMLQPLGNQAGEVTASILDSVKRLKVGVLGFLGFLFLFYTSISMLEKIEESFNHIWRTRASRSFLRRLSDYLSFTLVGPLLVFSVFGGLSALMGERPNNPLFKGLAGLIYQSVQALLPYAFIIAAFTFAYRYIPNTRVKPAAALFGGIVAGLLWKTAGWAFSQFVANSTQYHAVYSSFAILILFMIWLYVSWLILLLGVQVSFYYQHPRYLRFKHGNVRLSSRLVERVGLTIMVLIGQHFYLGQAAWSAEALAERLDLPEDCVDEVLTILRERGLIMLLDQERQVFGPTRDLSTISVLGILSTLRRAHEDEFPMDEKALSIPAVDGLMDRLEQAHSVTLEEMTLRDLIISPEIAAD
ncbi:MAG TPA: YhjD/YihY/BrkB family envelope integrity protein [Methylococcaceae bacterium]|nr:YhjD/YihY/BrkB family envelope integrity protein [Methylococcaceae bacterium]